MTRKFLFCFPLRLGNVVFGYIVIILSLAVLAFNLYMLALALVSPRSELDDRFRDFQHVDSIFGPQKQDLIFLVVLAYYSTYVAIAFLLFIFASLFTCGAYNANSCLITTFFGYCLVHLFLSLGLLVWEALLRGWLQLGLVLASDVALVACLCSVRYLLQAIRGGHMYSRPGEVYHKY